MLDLLTAILPTWPLEWHYRSRDETLIAFSNRQIYNDRLITFPGPGGPPAVSHELVPHIPGRDGDEDSAADEVRRVVDLVLQHAAERPNETLGVIALGIRHAKRLEAALDQAQRERPELDPFFDQNRDERFFVKNLERVQGDERDAIILSIGYGKDRAGRLPYRFGPILLEGGERRLNVAVTRARRRLTLISSFNHYDMDPGRTRSRGVELLRLYLEYAASGGMRLGDAATGEPLNPFELDVLESLQARGIPLIPQWGASRYRIDFVAQHPEQPGRFVLAIECDGASYHSAPTARDRDRLRQQQLESLGWRFHRIWSSDWFMQKPVEVERAVAAYQAAVNRADLDDTRSSGAAARPGTDRTATEPGPPRHTVKPDAVTTQRGPRPRFRRQDNITLYSDGELLKLLQWIQSDGLLRTDDQLIDEMVKELGFQRRGTRITSRLQQIVDQNRFRQRRA